MNKQQKHTVQKEEEKMSNGFLPMEMVDKILTVAKLWIIYEI